MARSSAKRSADYRARSRAGRIRITVEVDHFTHSEMLTEHGLLEQWSADDIDAVGAATERLLELLSRLRVTRDGDQ